MPLLRGTARSSSSHGPGGWFSAFFALTATLALGACGSDKCKSECQDTQPQVNDADAAQTTRSSSEETNTSSQASTSNSQATESSPVVPQLFSCRDDNDCVATPFPACSRQLHQCVACTQNDHCEAGKPRCAVRSSDELNRCVQCQTGSECESGLCRDDICLVCDPDTNLGCNSGTCLATEDQAAECVECVGDKDCTTGVCVDHTCKTCDVNSGAGCALGTVCLRRAEVEPSHALDASAPMGDADAAIVDPATDTEDGVCVECAESRPCSDPSLPVCLDNTCVACDPAATSNNGCTPLAPICLPGPQPSSEPATNLDASTAANRCVECVDASDCENAQCVEHMCQPCDPTTHAGCADGDVCLPRVQDNAQPAIAYQCLECSNEHACQGGLHCGTDGKCHECVDSSHCANPTKPFCQSDGTCGACKQDDQCPSEKHCWLDTGTCVNCLEDEHCAGSPTGSACAVDLHSCVECTATNLDACNGNPCQLIKPNQYQCFDEDDPASPDGGTSTECNRCTGPEDCDAHTDCAVLGDSNLRCVPLASEASERTDCEVRSVTSSEGQTQTYCVPFGC